MTMVQFSAEAGKGFSSLHCYVRISSGTHSASCSVGSRGLYPWE